MSLDGPTVLIGARNVDGAVGANQGTAYVFRRRGVDWIETGKLVATDAATDDDFGFSVSVSGGVAWSAEFQSA